jgi:WhiB family transcriptional regulator, redox-sensing transcriptional regulator
MTVQHRKIRAAEASYGWGEPRRPGPVTILDEILLSDPWPDTPGNCYDTSTNMFPREGTKAERVALALCRGCQIRTTCLNVALAEEDQFGVWGGVSAAARRRMKATVAA